MFAYLHVEGYFSFLFYDISEEPRRHGKKSVIYYACSCTTGVVLKDISQGTQGREAGEGNSLTH